eukprot:TRINITY_DN81947_c0_g1_i1.p1 TRINITY_DN81947_c0_g1~~TRINITY_DN81947_c0_g1_i1.p1  ORF type:complete len:663 (-),score=20.39 TRINITY_DN81947_c0_g1_i1:58-2046(-)
MRGAWRRAPHRYTSTSRCLLLCLAVLSFRKRVNVFLGLERACAPCRADDASDRQLWPSTINGHRYTATARLATGPVAGKCTPVTDGVRSGASKITRHASKLRQQISKLPWVYVGLGLAIFLLPNAVGAALAVGSLYIAKRRPAQSASKEPETSEAWRTIVPGGGDGDSSSIPRVVTGTCYTYSEPFLNAILVETWPVLTEYISTLLRSNVERALEKKLPRFLKGAQFGDLDFGDTAIRVEQISVQPFVNQTYLGESRDMEIECQVVWDTDIAVSLSLGGKTVNLGVDRIDVNGRLCIYLNNALARLPFYSGVRIYFASTPDISVEIAGGDPKWLDWVERIIADVVKQQLSSRLVLPNILAIQMDRRHEETWFQLKRVLPHGVITVHICQAEDLAAADTSLLPWQPDSSDPYFEMQIGAQTWATTVRANTLNPKWNEAEGTHTFVVHDLSRQLLTLKCFDEDTGTRDDFLGDVSVNLKEMVPVKAEPEWLPLEHTPKGYGGRVQIRFVSWSTLTLDANSLNAVTRDGRVAVLFVGVSRVSLRRNSLSDWPNLDSAYIQVEISSPRYAFSWKSRRVRADSSGVAVLEQVLPPAVMPRGAIGDLQCRVLAKHPNTRDGNAVLNEVASYSIEKLLVCGDCTDKPCLNINGVAELELIVQARASVPS